ncbi:aldo/keto reductase [Streptomyces noursei]|uniref:Aldo/keto reductase n=1 Tax=Streptomyces noursei TaxID=1971 RepID=A0A2N8PJD1_STRNR|nr:aldo/keto reductase [Streptomyces noursei]PNE41133.1 aldo/keto reductase [Streptomyces noursei]
MKTRMLGGLEVSAIGLGCMGMSQNYGPADRGESIAALRRSLDLGMTFLDSSDMYGRGHNEELIAEAIAGRRDEVVIATKFGIRGWSQDRSFELDSSPAYAKQACEASLRRLGVDVIDLYYLHRRDRSLPIEEIIGGMAELVTEGKVRHIGLSEVSEDTLRRAHATYPLAALESEYSLFARHAEPDVLPACRELGIGVAAFSPLGRGMLTGTVRDLAALSEDDYRHTDPRFQGENLTHNLALVERIQSFADEAGATPGQIALAWLLAKDEHIVPIPGTKRVRYAEENAAAAEVELTKDQVDALDALMPGDAVAGERYPEGIMRTIDA